MAGMTAEKLAALMVDMTVAEWVEMMVVKRAALMVGNSVDQLELPMVVQIGVQWVEMRVVL